MKKIYFNIILRAFMYKHKYIIFLLLLFVQYIGVSETIEKISSFMGRHFIVAFMQNEINRASTIETSFLSIFISSTQQDTVIVSSYLKKDTLFLSPSEVREIILPNEIEVRTFGVSTNKQIEINSKYLITCWVYSSKNQSSDSYVAFPVGRWGMEHRIISMPNDLYNGTIRQREDNAIDTNGNIIDTRKYAENLTPRSGEFLILSSLDNTQVKYYPTANTINGTKRGDSATVILNKGDVFLVQTVGGDIGTEDLTGTLVISNNPIGVLSGHVRTAITQGLDLPYDTKDHLVEMLPATNFWGRKFITVPFIDGQKPPEILCASGDLIKVVASKDSTKINYSIHLPDGTFDTHTISINKAGDFFELEANSPIFWTSNNPILVNQMMMHKGGKSESLNYDPSLVVIPPVEQFVESVTFSTPRNSKIFDQYKAHCVIVVADSTSMENLYLDNYEVNKNTTSIWKKRIGSSNYYWTMLDVKNGNHKLLCKNGVFSGIIYGHGYRDSYSMTLGSKMSNPDKPDTLAPQITLKDSCGCLQITITDILAHDKNATGIDWIHINKNTKNYSLQPFEISDTATIINLYAEPTDRLSDALLELELYDKSYNKTKFQHNYSGFKFSLPEEYNFGRVNWITPTTAEIKLSNNSTIEWDLEAVIFPDDARLVVNLPVTLPYKIKQNETLDITITFTPDGNNTAFISQLVLKFNCGFQLTTVILGEVSAPGLLLNNIDFGKVRLGDEKTLSGKLINAGNINIEVTGFINTVNEAAFKWDYSPTVPCFLPVNSEITYTATFLPLENRQYTEHTKIINDVLIDTHFITTGTGISPDIQDIYIDFGRHRIGTSLDTIIYLYNSGNCKDTVNYKKNISTTHDDAISLSTLQSIKNIVLDEQDSLEMKLNFSPSDTLPMLNKVELESMWKYHKPIYTTIVGQGTLPAIKTTNYDFGTVPIYSVNKSNANIIKSIGNEDLTIDSIVFISGDIASFDINYDLLKNILLSPNSSLECAITFTPQYSGYHNLLLCVTHDANPNYIRSTDTIHISGNAVSDNKDYIFSLQISQLDACTSTDAILLIENYSTGKLIIDSINISCLPEIFEASILDDIYNLFPIEINSGKSISIPIEVYSERNKFGKLFVEVNYNSEEKKVLLATINPIAYDIISEAKLNKNSLSPGDTVSLILQSVIEQTSEDKFEFNIKLHLDKKIFYLLEKITYINIISGATTNKVQANLSQYDDFVDIKLVDFDLQNIIINDRTIIKIIIPFLILLNSETETEISYSLESARCYNPGINNFFVNISKVCAHDLRQIKFGNLPIASVSSSLSDKLIDLSINLPEKDIINLQLVDIFGRIRYEKLDICLDSGKHSIILDVSCFPTSEYFIKLTSLQINKTLKILVIH